MTTEILTGIGASLAVIAGAGMAFLKKKNGRNGNGNNLKTEIAVLQNEVEHISKDVASIKSDMRRIFDKFDRLEK